MERFERPWTSGSLFEENETFVPNDIIIVVSWCFQAMRWTTTSQTPISTPPVWSPLAPAVVNLPSVCGRDGYTQHSCWSPKVAVARIHVVAIFFCFTRIVDNYGGVCLDSGKTHQKGFPIWLRLCQEHCQYVAWNANWNNTVNMALIFNPVVLLLLFVLELHTDLVFGTQLANHSFRSQNGKAPYTQIIFWNIF